MATTPDHHHHHRLAGGSPDTLDAWDRIPSGGLGLITYSPYQTITTRVKASTMTTYRITFRDAQYKEHTYPVISTSAHQAVADLARLGYQITKVVHSFPSV